MGVDYSTEIIYGFTFDDEDPDVRLRAGKYYTERYPDEDPEDAFLDEALKVLLAKKKFGGLLVFASVGSIPYGGDGQYAIGIRRLSKSIQFREEFTDFLDLSTADPTDEELNALSLAYEKITRRDPSTMRVKMLVGTSVY